VTGFSSEERSHDSRLPFQKATAEVFWRPTTEYQNGSLFAEDLTKAIDDFLTFLGVEGAVYVDTERR
jgi:muconolactone delta-isomerase